LGKGAGGPSRQKECGKFGGKQKKKGARFLGGGDLLREKGRWSSVRLNLSKTVGGKKERNKRPPYKGGLSLWPALATAGEMKEEAD